MEEDATDNSDESKRNQAEATIALKHVAKLVKSGVRVQDIGVITPYSAQVLLYEYSYSLPYKYDTIMALWAKWLCIVNKLAVHNTLATSHFLRGLY